VSNVDVQRILGAMNYKDYSADRAILITTSDFTKMAIEQARGNPIELWNNAKLKREIAKYLINTIK
jgi:HJR/Mrr/RecB family endonuclease